jgi:threonine aldolase
VTEPIDLRSDTVTKPGGAMREAMATAEVGDDVFGDDPTVNQLEALAAELLGKDAAVYVPSGTMANLIAVMTHTKPTDEVLLGEESHIFNYEVAGSASIAGVQVHALPNLPDGSMEIAAVAAAIREENIHAPRTSLLCLENTHNRCGGAVVPVDDMDSLAELAHSRGMSVHLDGARVFNAAATLGVSPERIAQECDTVSFCLSKGLGCPVGSLLCGPEEFVLAARRNRKMLGGGMRQAGILAAAGIYALDHHRDRLCEDHANAKTLAAGLGAHNAFSPNTPESNIIVADVVEGDVATWLARFREAGVLAVPFGANRFRMVTHLDVSAADIRSAVERIDGVVSSAS